MTRRLHIFALMTTVILSAQAEENPGTFFRVTESDNRALICEVRFDSISAVMNSSASVRETEIVFPNCAFTDIGGWPKLPVTALTLGIPAGAVPRLTILDQEVESVPVQHIVTVPLLQKEEPVTPLPSDTWYPGEPARIGLQGMIRNQPVCQVELRPVRYLPSAKLVQIVRRMRIRLDLEGMSEAIESSAGPDTGPFEPVLERALSNYMSSVKWRTAPPAPRSLNKQSAGFSNPNRLKLSVESGGVYALSGQELSDIGVDLAGISVNSLSLSNRGRPVPILLQGHGDGSFDAGDRLIFIGDHNRGPERYYSSYTETNVYWLSWGGDEVGARFAELSGAPKNAHPDTITSAPALIHMETDERYERLLQYPYENEDHWFWRAMGAGAAEYRFRVPPMGQVVGGRAALRIALHGQTHTSGEPDHHVIIRFNDRVVGDLTWEGQNPYLFNAESIPVETQPEGDIIAFALPGDLPGASIDQVLLNWIELSYQRVLDAVDDSLKFTHQGAVDQLFLIRGYENKIPLILSANGVRVTGASWLDGSTLAFRHPVNSDMTYYIAGERALKRVKTIERDEPSDLASSVQGADYVIITHADFRDQAERLAAHRRGRGLRTVVVDVRDIYDEFNFGIYHPDAIRSFLKYAYYNWTRPALLYVLLLGDTTHNMDKRAGRNSAQRSFIPTMMQYTRSWGMTSSDNYFAAICGDDDLPDLYIGRLPANDASQAEIMVSKIIDYENRPVIDEWRRHIALLNGSNSFFENSAQYLYDEYIPARLITNRISTIVESPYFGSTEQVVSLFNKGQALVNFIGHGGGGAFSDAELFLNEDVQLLDNRDRYPVVFSMTCFIGHFDNEEKPSLAEVMLTAPEKGIVAHFGSAGRAYLMGDYFLNNALFDVVFRQNVRILGAISTFGKYEMINQTLAYWDHVKNYNLLGDPALEFHLPGDELELSLQDTLLAPGDELTVQGRFAEQVQGRLVLSAYNDRDSLLTAVEIPIEGDSFSEHLFTLDAGRRSAWPENGGEGVVRAYLKESNSDAAGALRFTVARPLILEAGTRPLEPVHMDSIYFFARLDTAGAWQGEGLSSVEIKWSKNQRDWQTLPLERGKGEEWSSLTPIQHWEGTTVAYRVVIRARSGKESVSEERRFKVGYRPDLYVDRSSIRVTGTDEVRLTANVANGGDRPSGPFQIQVFNGFEPDDAVLIVPDILIADVAPGESAEFTFPLESGEPGSYQLAFNVDAEAVVEESNERNNLTEKALKIVTAARGSGSPINSRDFTFSLHVPPGAVTANSAVELFHTDESRYLKAAEGASLLPVALRGMAEPKVCGIGFDAQRVKPVQITLYFERDDTEPLKIYAWNEESGTWGGLVSTLDAEGGAISASLDPDGSLFALMASADRSAPVIRISVEGQNFVDGDFISRNPTFTFLLEDSSGFDTARSPVTIELDGEALADQAYTLYTQPDNPRQITATWIPELEPGHHELVIEAVDLNGNAASTEAAFEVSSHFSLSAIANHPNPFVNATTIAFTLTDMAEHVIMDIFTVSGRRIRSFHMSDISGYIETEWDGLDEHGRRIANGVYYLRFKAVKGEKTISTIEKMAKLE